MTSELAIVNENGYLIVLGSKWEFHGLTEPVEVEVSHIEKREYAGKDLEGQFQYYIKFKENLPLNEYHADQINGRVFTPAGKTRIVLNQIKTPDGTVLTSRNRHDYQQHEDKTGDVYGVDGGFDYLRRTGYPRSEAHDGYIEMSVTSKDPFEKIRKSFHWGTLGKNRFKQHVYKPMSVLSNDHVENIINDIDTRSKVRSLSGAEEFTKGLMEKELLYREIKNITILDRELSPEEVKDLYEAAKD